MTEFQPRSLRELEFEFPPELDHVSASSIKMAVRCEEQWRQRYILGKKIVPSLAMLLGRADHGAIEHSMVQKIETHEDLPVSEVKEFFVYSLESEVEKEGGISEVEVTVKGEPASTPQKIAMYDKERTQGQQVVEVYHRNVSPLIQPRSIEKSFEVQIPGLPVRMTGRIDMIGYHEGVEDTMIDRKRKTRAITKPDAEWSIQADVYQWVEPIPHAWHVSVSKKEPEIVTNLWQPVRNRANTEMFLNQLVAKLGWLYQKYGPDEPWPTTGKLHPWACGYCGFRDNCWGWK